MSGFICSSRRASLEYFRRDSLGAGGSFADPFTRKWERFCRDGGLIALATGGLLFVTLPLGIGVFGIIYCAAPPLLFLL